MKCPRCWANKAYFHPVKGWKGLLLSCLFLVPMRCQHCYHRFLVSWFTTIGQQLEPPAARSSSISSNSSFAMHRKRATPCQSHKDHSFAPARRRADAA